MGRIGIVGFGVLVMGVVKREPTWLAGTVFYRSAFSDHEDQLVSALSGLKPDATIKNLCPYPYLSLSLILLLPPLPTPIRTPTHCWSTRLFISLLISRIYPSISLCHQYMFKYSKPLLVFVSLCHPTSTCSNICSKYEF